MHRDRLPRPSNRSSRRGAPALLLVIGLAVGTVAGVRSAPADSPAAPPVRNPHGSFKGECSQCHGESGWTPARISRKFDHGKFGFPLRGAHAAAPCRACHESLEFASAPTACAACHEDVHRGELGVDCARCHTSRSFIDRVGMVRAHRLTRFPLQGAHASVECEGCHPAEPSGHMRFTGTDVACVACHLAEYQATTNPAHAAAGFSMECRTCHTMIAWQPARFDHAGTGFPLTGAHKTVPCAQCHVGGAWTGLDPACVSCHRKDYDATTDPSHTTLAFPTTCADCHTTTTWSGAKFIQHDTLYFPIYSGRHLGTWTSCYQCHNVSGDYTAFTCLDCHPHDDQAGTDSHHVGIAGYQYLSSACYSCHPRGTTG
jgi:nitrate/TMAO reductase-like tetraheme cytochrome c subunit